MEYKKRGRRESSEQGEVREGKREGGGGSWIGGVDGEQQEVG